MPSSNPFQSISDPKQLLALVQDGVECERCGGQEWVEVITTEYGGPDEYGEPIPIQGCDQSPCDCNSGHTPLSNADLDALTACWCEGEWVRAWGNNAVPHFWQRARAFNNWEEGFVWDLIPDYTTNPTAAMRLQVKYRLTNLDRLPMKGPISVEAICHMITTAALIAALTEAIEKGRK